MQNTLLVILCSSIILGGMRPSAIAQTGLPRGEALRHDVRPGRAVTETKRLSDYHPPLAPTPGDTQIYILDSKQPGGTVLVVGGTHGNEIAGISAAVLLVERARPEKGRLIVIPNANNSAVSYRETQRPGPESIEIGTASGKRNLRYGSRYTRPEHQGRPDSPRFQHPQSKEELAGEEARNLDRAYPGRADGSLTEQIAYAIMELLRREKVDIAFDLHEAGPDSRLAWMIVAHPKSVDLGALAVLQLDDAGIPMQLEPSSETFRGLSHREWGDHTPAHAFLFETPNPGQGRSSDKVDVVGDSRFPLARRIGVHLASLQAVLAAYNENGSPEKKILLQGLPSLKELLDRGFGAFLN